MMFRFCLSLIVVAFMSLVSVFCSAGEIEEGFGDLHLKEQWSGDYDGMAERKVIRVLVVHNNKMLYFLDHGRQRGVNVDLFDAFEKFINQKEKTYG